MTVTIKQLNTMVNLYHPDLNLYMQGAGILCWGQEGGLTELPQMHDMYGKG